MRYPQSVQIVEVGPRDGFQNINEWIPTDVKLRIIEGLVRANLQHIEVTSFVHPKAIPQMKDAQEIIQKVLKEYPTTEFVALVPNMYGARAAWNCGVKKITYVISASDEHNKANVNRTIPESFVELTQIIEELPEIKVKLSIATAFGCPYKGKVAVEDVNKMINAALGLGINDICLCDTIGIANPLQMQHVIEAIKKEHNKIELGLHLHDTRGLGVANTIVAMQSGITKFETAIGGLGGCPFAPGAAGNTSSEDLINMLESMGIYTGIDLPLLLDVVGIVKDKIKPDLTSRMIHVGKQKD
ncbi:MAG: hydroxymethylglutaryl-CoA lyase [Firmicutes bacterium HGW-Firmicutes-12]|jgi:hydroxymethylglutaryl-CoA lyase|nr:MAG: hydroxymethylglutaryl-CoA lyase [Firmicutes bacterium HGW-Firmicutes-12]